MPDRCGHVWRDRLTFELFQAEDGFEEFASCILAAKWKNSHPLFYLFILVLCGIFGHAGIHGGPYGVAG